MTYVEIINKIDKGLITAKSNLSEDDAIKLKRIKEVNKSFVDQTNWKYAPEYMLKNAFENLNKWCSEQDAIERNKKLNDLGL